MKTTIDIPEPLYRQTKIRAVEQGTTLKALVLEALERALQTASPSESDPRMPYSARRRLLPGYKAAEEAGAYRGGRDSTETISEERDAR
jgi:hypothetical protein